MPFREINRKIVIQKEVNLQHRFYQDFAAKLTLNCWLAKDTGGEFHVVEKFHIGKRSYIFEWFAGKNLSYSEIDDGYNMMGVKRSPIAIAGANWNEQRFREICRYFENYGECSDDAIQFVMNVILEEGRSSHTGV